MRETSRWRAQTPMEPTSPEGATTSSEACEAIQYAALAASALATAVMGFFSRATRTSSASSGTPSTVPPGESTSMTMRATAGSATASRRILVKPSVEVPPKKNDQRDGRWLMGPCRLSCATPPLVGRAAIAAASAASMSATSILTAPPAARSCAIIRCRAVSRMAHSSRVRSSMERVFNAAHAREPRCARGAGQPLRTSPVGDTERRADQAAAGSSSVNVARPTRRERWSSRSKPATPSRAIRSSQRFAYCIAVACGMAIASATKPACLP